MSFLRYKVFKLANGVFFLIVEKHLVETLVLSYDSFFAMSFSRDNMHKEFKLSSVMENRNLFLTKESFGEVLSASQLVMGNVKYSLCAVIWIGK
ncbi:Hypothetical predicted protein [Octopus vulgaris]|uniref:Uncharacterized protein n=1 Tax=Octopus vulgaris TaxID=6645 RepID=A0AA36F171_OCTVU|nr:Hypothetical predicted protein [Octopus vulgaris]